MRLLEHFPWRGAEDSGNEIGLLDSEQMERHFILCNQKEGGEVCQRGFAMKP